MMRFRSARQDTDRCAEVRILSMLEDAGGPAFSLSGGEVLDSMIVTGEHRISTRRTAGSLVVSTRDERLDVPRERAECPASAQRSRRKFFAIRCRSLRE